MRLTILYILSFSILLVNIKSKINYLLSSISSQNDMIENYDLGNDTINYHDSLSEIITFNYSECIKNCPKEGLIFNQEFKRDTLTLQIGSVKNCIGKFKIGHKLYNDTLELEIEVKGEIYKDKDGKTYEQVVLNTCECYFYFDIVIKNVKDNPRIIIVNNRKLRNSW